MKNNNSMKDKLIRDGSENQRVRYKLTMVRIGAGLLVIGLALLVIKGMSVEYIDEDGFLHENFFLVPIGMLFLLSGMVTFVIAGVRKLVRWIRQK